MATATIIASLSETVPFVGSLVGAVGTVGKAMVEGEKKQGDLD